MLPVSWRLHRRHLQCPNGVSVEGLQMSHPGSRHFSAKKKDLPWFTHWRLPIGGLKAQNNAKIMLIFLGGSVPRLLAIKRCQLWNPRTRWAFSRETHRSKCGVFRPTMFDYQMWRAGTFDLQWFAFNPFDSCVVEFPSTPQVKASNASIQGDCFRQFHHKQLWILATWTETIESLHITSVETKGRKKQGIPRLKPAPLT